MVLSPKETSEWETNTAFPEDRGVRGLCHHSEWRHVADAVIEAFLRFDKLLYIARPGFESIGMTRTLKGHDPVASPCDHAKRG